MILSRQNLKDISNSELIKPNDSIFQLPEKVLQFGTGVLLRGLPDYFIDKANRQGIFNGRIVVVKSTSSGSSSAFDQQDSLYTLAIRGIENGAEVQENIICSAISRVLSASTQWDGILVCAHNKEIQIVISNTTEVGLQLVLENIHQTPPTSFPAKLLAFLFERFTAFHGSAESGMVIIPTELIPDNGKKLKAIVFELAEFNALDTAFTKWLTDCNHFCSSLVDRIVPGKPEAKVAVEFGNDFGYTDKLLTVAEAYRLWAIEGDEKVKSILTFSQVDKGVIIAPDITIYRELKLRLLNATHTLSCGVAFLAGFETVKEGMEDKTLSHYSTDLMLNDIAVAIPYPIDKKTAHDFGLSVLDRFRNPHLKHLWLGITLQYSMKLKMRVLPVLLQFYKNFDRVPDHIALGFAAWILFMKVVKEEDDNYFGERNGVLYPIKDDQANYFFNQWNHHGQTSIVSAVLNDESFWGTNLNDLKGFSEAVDKYLKLLMTQGILPTIRK